MIDWNTLGQPNFDRIVEALIRHRFGETVRAVNGMGGDGGIDVEIRPDGGGLWILQLKYFPDGFSSVRGARRKQIARSFQAASKHSPAKWTLVVPWKCTNSEHRFVKNLGGGKRPPVITIIDRDELDAWLADAPQIERWAHRNVTSELREMARDFGQETAALLGGMPDLVTRVHSLGRLADATDLDWKVAFTSDDDVTALTIRPRHPDAATRSPIRLIVETDQLDEDHHPELQENILRTLAYAPSGRLRIPGEVVRSVRFDGPEFITGNYPPGTVEIVTEPSGAAIGQRLEVRVFRDDDLIASFEGRITHAAPGAIGASIEVSLCSGNLDMRVRLPFEVDSRTTTASPEFPAPGMDLRLNYDAAVRPAQAEEALSTYRVLYFATRLEFRFNGDLLAAVQIGSPRSASDYNEGLLAMEQFAYDLDVVQRHTGHFFDMPDELRPGDRVRMRVARLLIEGYVVASPRARVLTLGMTGTDTPAIRARLLEPQPLVWPVGPHTVEVAGRELVIGDVCWVHPQATAINGNEAVAALDSGQAEGFEVRFRPGDDPYFYLTLANRSREEISQRYLALWSLHGVDQPGVVDGQDSFELA
ncbi:hypothetical protein [Mycolicibacter longobardus]|uniref:Uncharacterized protein n=1 Tax=Mycolicibacter longobardus TaxID=1108812 RepID=A0A1X1YP43_9MYCO|nr:hypothetical protein [Mycolicibacter longobardus]MCV7384401.1 hypothetical protein [Mycolicibacter longobardus]ORW12877.1 hypothetical protein AWC16_06960 [Mycolicibacter longobardus]